MDGRPWPARVRLERVRPEARELRCYEIALWPCLWEGVLLARMWGRIGQPARIRLDWYPDVARARRAWAALLRAKRRSGYRRVSGAARGNGA